MITIYHFVQKKSITLLNSIENKMLLKSKVGKNNYYQNNWYVLGNHLQTKNDETLD